MDTVKKIFEKMKFAQELADADIASLQDEMDDILKPFFDDNQNLQEAIKKAPDANDYTWVFDGTEIASWVRLDLSDFKGDDEKPCLLDALERYLDSDETYLYLDRDNECLFSPQGPSIVINDDGDIYDEEDCRWIIKPDDYTFDDEMNEDYRNHLIEEHMEKTGCFPGVFSSDRYGNVYAINTMKKSK